ncbi:MAG: hypothetical protein QXX51_01320 [Candidatus Bathyarchaeia archaeon]
MAKTISLKTAALLLVLVVGVVYAVGNLMYQEKIPNQMTLKASYQIELRFRENSTRILSYDWGEYVSRGQNKTLEALLVYTGTMNGYVKWTTEDFPGVWILEIWRYVGNQWEKWDETAYGLYVSSNNQVPVNITLTENGATCGTPYSFTLVFNVYEP